MRLQALTGLLMAGALGGCISMSDSTAVRPVSNDVASNSRVTSIVLTKSDNLDVSSEFESVFRAKVADKLINCATGSREVRLEARIWDLNKANPAMTYLIAGQNSIRGTAKIYDANTGELLGEYNIQASTTGTGLIAAAYLAEAEENLSSSFGEQVCKQAFTVKKVRKKA